MINWPTLTLDNLKFSGAIKTAPEDFIVREIPLYQPSGQGQHIYLTITKTNLNTKDLARKLAAIFKRAETEVGFAGLKDKFGITTQTISLDLGVKAEIEEVLKLIAEKIPEVKVESATRHINKIKTGHLIGNQFELLIKSSDPEALTKAKKIAENLRVSGIPNYYGPQRFGSKFDNHLEGREILLGNKFEKKHWIKKLKISAWQSFWFNEWLALRIKSNLFDQLIAGDLLVNNDGGQTFSYSQDSQIEEFQAKKISYTGPMFGSSTKMPELAARELEEKIFLQTNLTQEVFQKNRIDGTRRAARITIDDLKIEQTGEKICLKFSLPSGSYATALLREFLLNEFEDIEQEV